MQCGFANPDISAFDRSQHGSSPPLRYIGFAFSPPIANSLDRQTSSAGELRGASVESGEDFGYRVHTVVLSEKRIRTQAVFNPNLAEDSIVPCALKKDVFDPEQFRHEMAIALKASNYTQASLARRLNLTSQSAVSNILKGVRRVTPAEVADISHLLGMSEGPAARSIPFIGLASAGVWQEAIEMTGGNRFIPSRMCGKRAFAVEIVGDSMDKLLPEGGWAVVDPDQKHLYTGKVYIIANADEETTVKRYCGDPGRFEPVSNNEMHQPFYLTDVPYRVIGRVVSYGSEDGL
jgi:SOS-response transcriptional repressor LexA